MKTVLKICTLSILSAVLAAAQPSISSVLNNYSFTLPGLPNYGIAQGSIFAMYGNNMGPAQIASQSFPLNKTLSGVSINVTVSGTTVQPIPYYVSATQIGAILPSSTPVGTGQITVTYNGQTSSGTPIKVVPADFGLLTLAGNGTGPAAAFDAHYAYLGPTNAANPGETIILWGTGVGPASGDETAFPFPQVSLTTPMEVTIGGQTAQVVYHGRSQFPGLDQINVTIPQAVSGCYVSVIVRTGNFVSNSSSIPVAASGRTCSETTAGISSSDIQALLGQASVSVGTISLGKITTQTPQIGGFGGGTSTTDSAGAAFLQFTPAQFTTSNLLQQASIGGCLISTFQGQGAKPPAFQGKFLDAGAAINVTLPDGSVKQMPRLSQSGFITYSLTGGGTGAGATPTFIPTGGGHFKFDNGSGGPDVGAFTAATDTSAPLVWSNMSSIGPNVSLTQSLDVTWTGGDPSSYVVISGSSVTVSPIVAVTFSCTERVSAGHFTIPAAVLLSLPPTESVGGISVPTGSLSVGSYSAAQKFTAPGVDIGFVQSYTSSGKSVSWTNP